MSREIKFRAWDKVDKRMIIDEQDFIPLIVTNVGVLRLSATNKDNLYSMVDRDRFKITQYTGLKDKNGVDIYEGDIVIYHMPDSDPAAEVVWDDASVRFRFIDSDGFSSYGVNKKDVAERCKVIGNIYENPDLVRE